MLTDVEEAVEDVVVTVVMVAVTVVFGQTPHRAGHFSATGVPKTVRYRILPLKALWGQIGASKTD